MTRGCCGNCQQGRKPCDCGLVNDTTRRYPRSMQAAFGPHTDHSIDDEEPKLGLLDAAFAVLVGVCVAAGFFFWLSR